MGVVAWSKALRWYYRAYRGRWDIYLDPKRIFMLSNYMFFVGVVRHRFVRSLPPSFLSVPGYCNSIILPSCSYRRL